MATVKLSDAVKRDGADQLPGDWVGRMDVMLKELLDRALLFVVVGLGVYWGLHRDDEGHDGEAIMERFREDLDKGLAASRLSVDSLSYNIWKVTRLAEGHESAREGYRAVMIDAGLRSIEHLHSELMGATVSPGELNEPVEPDEAASGLPDDAHERSRAVPEGEPSVDGEEDPDDEEEGEAPRPLVELLAGFRARLGAEYAWGGGPVYGADSIVVLAPGGGEYELYLDDQTGYLGIMDVRASFGGQQTELFLDPCNIDDADQALQFLVMTLAGGEYDPSWMRADHVADGEPERTPVRWS